MIGIDDVEQFFSGKFAGHWLVPRANSAQINPAIIAPQCPAMSAHVGTSIFAATMLIGVAPKPMNAIVR
ncbi:hypothetical protein [Klebsiella pneumoniae]|uniref:hypothetical protein n=1 Tax=Klebsiella pneumoniae TaxID=573 RepID=UPI001864348C|nr:hypothetical protein [Klebsiella pneumoniae]